MKDGDRLGAAAGGSGAAPVARAHDAEAIYVAAATSSEPAVPAISAVVTAAADESDANLNADASLATAAGRREDAGASKWKPSKVLLPYCCSLTSSSSG